MNKIVECVPNFSEGRDASKVAEIEAAILTVPGVVVLDSHMDADHHRSVITFAGEPDAILEAALRAAKRAVELIDLNQHQGEHPRIGAIDVLPFVPIKGVTMDECVALAHQAGERIARELKVPVYLYERAALRPERRDLADIRRGEFEELRDEIESNPERVPDFGDARLHPTAGAVAVGARPLLIAFNVNLASDDLDVAKKIARAVRGRDGGLQHVKALGLMMKRRGHVQVAMNLVDFKNTPVFRAFDLVSREAERYGIAVSGSEIVGLVPQEALNDCADHALRLENLRPDIVLENRLRTALAFELDEVAAVTSARDRFFDHVAAGKAVPGGGSVAACAGALAAALGAMTCRMTISRDHLVAIDDEVQVLLADLEDLRAGLRTAIDDDAESFERFLAARRLSQQTEAERLQRTMAVEQALKGAMAVPLRVAEYSMAVLELLDELSEISIPQGLADLAVGAEMGLAAVRGAATIVMTNLSALGDEEANHQTRRELDDLIARADEIVRGIEAQLRAKL